MTGVPEPRTELRQLWVFLVLASELHFARTAHRCGLSPSRVSQTVRDLERLVGAALFERSSRRVELTPVGHELKLSLTPAYAQLLAAVDRAREIGTSGLSGVLRLGLYAPIAGGRSLPDIITAFEQHHPSCSVRHVDTNVTSDMLAPLRRGEVDVAVLRRPLTEPDIVLGPTLTRDTRVIAVAAGHPLAGRASIRWDDLAEETLSLNVSVPTETMDAFIPPFTSDGRRIKRIEGGSYAEIMMRVAQGEMIHPTVAAFVDYYRHPGLVAVPIDDLPATETALAWLRDATDPKITAFVATAENVLAAGPDGLRR